MKKTLTARRNQYLLLIAVLSVFALPRLLDRLFPLDLQRYQQTATIVTDRNGEWLRGYLSADQHWRLALETEQLPLDYLRLLITYEDRRFYQHGGIDYLAIARAAGQNLASAKIVSGASTLSMQTARLLMPHSRDWQGKIGELFRAWQLERHFSKEQILQIYMQLAPMGGNLEGIAGASRYYFNKPADKLSLAEAAWLVSLPQSPHFYNPLRYPEQAKQARNRVLQRAFAFGQITQEQYQNAVAQALEINPTPFPFSAPHFTDRLKRTQPNAPLIRSSLDKPLQQGLESLLQHSLPQRHPNGNLAAAIMDNHSGEFLAYVGSADFFSVARQGQVDMLQAIRSPGSALKPFITLFAFDWLNYQPTTLIQDTPIVDDNYQPNNYDGAYQGEITLASALQRSRNVPAVRLLRAINPFRFNSHLQRHGLPLYLPPNAQPNLALALGGVGIKGTDLLQLYRTLANCSYGMASANPLASPQSCWQVTEILQQNQDQNGRLFWGKEPVAFKTGTAYGWRDQWLFAYTRDYSMVLWGGRADGKFATRRASAEDLIPLLRKVIGLLPNPPREYRAPSYPLAIQHGKLPPRLQRVEHPASNRTLTTKTSALSIIAPLNHSRLELPQRQDLTLQISGGTPPYLWFLNDHLIYQGNDLRYLLSQNDNQTQQSSYRLVVIDADGNSAQSDFSLRFNQVENSKRENRVKIIRSASPMKSQPVDKN
ncbi:penicillin-binding protein 1C [Testudinibacter sp. P80/BLE/0925]|uniref:penicillin-binding protein 1C n=1 Tax=Testudinibacter sp. TW-1 TaxID=3417757 RepID=UPI003D35A28F